LKIDVFCHFAPARYAERLQTLEPVVAPSVRQGKVKVVGATYDLRSGRVTLIT